MKRLIAALACAVFALAGVMDSPSLAGEEGQDSREGAEPAHPSPGGQTAGGPVNAPAVDDPDADLEETIQIYMIARMKRFLSLSREQEERVVPFMQDLGDSRRRFTRDRRLTMMMLRPLAEDPASSEEEIGRLLLRLDESEREFRARETKSLQQIRAVLAPRQQARFMIFQERFRSEMQQRVRDIRGGGPGGRGGPEDRPRGTRGGKPIPPGERR